MKGVTDLMSSESDQADLTPMIDCVFLLLLFFIVTSTFSDQSLFEIDLPQAKHASSATTDDACILTISEHGNYAIGNTPLSDEQLGAHIEAMHEEKPITLFVINGDKKAPYEKIARAIDIAQGLQVENLSFTVQY
ncbi:MAG: biopolymer transporter ExbD [Planctomycetes bacterium]|nr:biopolymer transporter ExbD [Planctomycetota bacterium]